MEINVTTVGLDLAKSSFHVFCGDDLRGGTAAGHEIRAPCQATSIFPSVWVADLGRVRLPRRELKGERHHRRRTNK